MARASPIDKIVLVEMTNVEGGLFRISFQDFSRRNLFCWCWWCCYKTVLVEMTNVEGGPLDADADSESIIADADADADTKLCWLGWQMLKEVPFPSDRIHRRSPSRGWSIKALIRFLRALFIGFGVLKRWYNFSDDTCAKYVQYTWHQQSITT